MMEVKGTETLRVKLVRNNAGEWGVQGITDKGIPHSAKLGPKLVRSPGDQNDFDVVQHYEAASKHSSVLTRPDGFKPFQLC